MRIMRRQLSTAARTVSPGGCLLREEGLAMIVFADAGLRLGFRRRHVARPPAASGLPPPPSLRSPSDQCRSMRKRMQTTPTAC
jgi:hypothetical protein